VFERFTDRARRVVVLAQQEARMLNHNYIGTEHILLGLLHEGDGVAAIALEALGVSLEEARREVETIIGHGQSAPTGHIPFTPRAKKVLELALKEALEIGHNYIGTEHILLGILREGEGVGAQVLEKLGASLEGVREKVIEILSGYQQAPPEPSTSGEAAPQRIDPEAGPYCPRCRARLEESAAYRVLDLPAASGGDSRATTFAYCRRCGTWLGTVA
jgi:ATP-dependent Clp protease ATP-binding subunit ClpC